MYLNLCLQACLYVCLADCGIHIYQNTLKCMLPSLNCNMTLDVHLNTYVHICCHIFNLCFACDEMPTPIIFLCESSLLN